jgi:hypothetical protein
MEPVRIAFNPDPASKPREESPVQRLRVALYDIQRNVMVSHELHGRLFANMGSAQVGAREAVQASGDRLYVRFIEDVSVLVLGISSPLG